MEDFIEKPSCQILYRQSSLETRLSPVHLSEESSESSDDEVKNINSVPRIVNVQMKTPQGTKKKNNEEQEVTKESFDNKEQEVKKEDNEEQEVKKEDNDKLTAVYLMKSK